MGNSTYLVGWDVDQIRAYLFATGRLKEIRGASRIVDRLTDEAAIKPMLPSGADLIYAGGGAGMATFPDEGTAEQFERELQQIFSDGTVVASISTARVPYSGSFKDDRLRLGRQLRRKKDEGRAYLPSEITPYTMFCESCRTYPAIVRYPYAQRGWLCMACTLKRAEFDRKNPHRKRLLEREELGTRQFGTEMIQRLSKLYGNQVTDTWQRVAIADDLSELGAVSQPANYIGLIYADGNRMGNYIQEHCTDEMTLRDFSTDVEEATYTALLDALSQHIRPERQYSAAPFEVLFFGGDDLLLVTSAELAVPVARTLCVRFTEYMCAKGYSVTMSAGVVLAHPSQPVVFLEEQARALAREAKKESARRSNVKPVPTIDFWLARNPALNPIPQMRRTQYEDDGDDTRITQRPYTADDLKELLCQICRFKQGTPQEGPFPRNKLNALYTSLFQGKAVVEYQAWLLYWRLAKSHRSLLSGFGEKFHGGESNLVWGPDPSKQKTSATALADMIELYDFVPYCNDIPADSEQEATHVQT